MTPFVPTVLVAALALTPTFATQPTPDFSGTWSMDASRSQSAALDEPVKSMTLVIKQSPTDLNIEYTRDGRVQTVTYKPGSPAGAGGPGATSATSGRASIPASVWYWDGPKIVTEALRDVNGTTVRHKATFTLEASGAELTVESLVVVEHGYTQRGAQNYGAGKDVFKKVAP
jgi:hypothetical protein